MNFHPSVGLYSYRGGVEWSATSRGHQDFVGRSKTTKGCQRKLAGLHFVAFACSMLDQTIQEELSCPHLEA
jgi:hypothetical protein